MILELKSISKIYRNLERELEVLHDISFSVKTSEIVSIVGPSGSGKTTLLGLCAGLDNPSGGTIQIDGQSINKMTENEKAALRNEKIGFIFQNFQLIPTLTALENVMVPIELQNQKSDATSIAIELLERVGLGDRLKHYPAQLSGGEQQRVSMARAFSNSPKLLFADEPTGNLDTETSEVVVDLIFQLNQEKGTTLIIVTHDLELAEKTQRIIRLKGGRIISDNPSTSQLIHL